MCLYNFIIKRNEQIYCNFSWSEQRKNEICRTDDLLKFSAYTERKKVTYRDHILKQPVTILKIKIPGSTLR